MGDRQHALASPSPKVMRNCRASVPVLAVAWADLVPDGATNTRNVFVHSPASGELDITWSNVPYFGVAGAITCQIALIDNGTNDRIELRYSAVSTPNLASLVGFSPGGGAVDPGTRDLTAGSFSTTATDLPGLSLAASPSPLLGSTVTYTVGNVRANASLSQILVNFNSSVPTPLSTIGIDAPGCLLHIPAAGSVGFSPLLLVNPTATFQFTLPVGASWAGVSLYLQALELAPAANPGGVISSNGLQTRMNTF